MKWNKAYRANLWAQRMVNYQDDLRDREFINFVTPRIAIVVIIVMLFVKIVM